MGLVVENTNLDMELIFGLVRPGDGDDIESEFQHFIAPDSGLINYNGDFKTNFAAFRHASFQLTAWPPTRNTFLQCQFR